MRTDYSIDFRQQLVDRQARPLYDVEKVVKRIDVSRFPIQFLLAATFDPIVRQWLIMVSMRVTARDGDHRITVANQVALHEDTIEGWRDRDGQLLDIIHRTLRSSVSHELDECFLVDGVRVRDPHRNEKLRGR